MAWPGTAGGAAEALKGAPVVAEGATAGGDAGAGVGTREAVVVSGVLEPCRRSYLKV